MSIEPNLLVATLIGGVLLLGIGVLIGRTVARPANDATLRDAVRDTFRALSDEALKSNNEAFLTLAATKLREVRATATAEIDQRNTAIEHLLEPMARTLSEVDRELKESERLRVESSAQLLQR